MQNQKLYKIKDQKNEKKKNFLRKAYRRTSSSSKHKKCYKFLGICPYRIRIRIHVQVESCPPTLGASDLYLVFSITGPWITHKSQRVYLIWITLSHYLELSHAVRYPDRTVRASRHWKMANYRYSTCVE